MEAIAKLKNCPMSPRKMRLIADLIRNKPVDEALGILKFTKNEAATWLEKLLLSAVANWEYKLEGRVDSDDYALVVKTIFVDGGRMLKRIQPAPQGRAHRVRKRSNHVTIIIENTLPLETESSMVEIEEE
ncbi:MAG TPA: 50S ribosomal protein L22 [Saprospiraceae bacterium]|nr:50S ribosomal protein L22 [Saprospiraceae bacterium]